MEKSVKKNISNFGKEGSVLVKTNSEKQIQQKSGRINDKKSIYYGKMCSIINSVGSKLNVVVLHNNKFIETSIPKDKFENLNTFEEGGKVSIVNEGIVFDKNKYKAIFGDFDKDGVVNIDDAFPNNKNRKKTVEDIQLAPIINNLLTLKTKLDSSMNVAVNELKEKSPKTANIYARTKTPYSIIKKLVDKRLLDEKKGLQDLIGTTIAVDTYAQLKSLKKKIDNGLLGEIFDYDDFYKNPNAGYMAYHYIIRSPENLLIEVQLKTKRMKSLNEISHEFYKKGNLDAKNFLEITKLTHLADSNSKFYINKYNYLMKRKSLLRRLLSGEIRINLDSDKMIG